jgi:hypothetical protein
MMEKRKLLQPMLLGKLNICLQKTKNRSMFVTLYKYQLKWIKDLNIRLKTLKLMQERTRNTLEAIGTSKDFFSRTQISQQLREGFTNFTT